MPGGQLTTKGGVLEVYMGHYMREWLAEEGVVTAGSADGEQRLCLCQQPATLYGGDRAVLHYRGLPGLRCADFHQEQMGTMDPTFNPVITDNSPEFREKALQAMNSRRQGMKLDEATACWSR